MIQQMINEMLNIRYIKIHFTLVFTEDTVMPKDKVSAFRGGIGDMLLRANCVRNRDCEKCDFESECIVRRIMYSKSEIVTKAAAEGESMGYVFECENLDEEFYEGDTLKLQLILFGKSIVYFNQYLQALSMLGRTGIGKNKSHFVIADITNSKQESILNDGNIYMEKYTVETIGDYVAYRTKQIKNIENFEIVAFSPITLKFRGELLNEFRLDAFYEAVVRRLYLLNCYEGIEIDRSKYRIDMYPYLMADSNAYPVTVKRYSNHKNQHMQLYGIKGNMQIVADENANRDVMNMMYQLLLAGEITHIGKNTSFGFGRYRILGKDSYNI